LEVGEAVDEEGRQRFDNESREDVRQKNLQLEKSSNGLVGRLVEQRRRPCIEGRSDRDKEGRQRYDDKRWKIIGQEPADMLKKGMELHASQWNRDDGHILEEKKRWKTRGASDLMMRGGRIFARRTTNYQNME
jgi:hypothetical protein